jgi:putative membrane protein
MAMQTRFWITLIFAVTQALTLTALAQSPQSPSTSSVKASSDVSSANRSANQHGMEHNPAAIMNVTPQSFATQAAVMGKAEVELGQLALEKSQDSNLRAYAQRMIRDHTAANAKLKKLATQENITLPATLDTEQQSLKQKLANLQGADFDRQYKQAMAQGHEKAVALFQSASQSPQMPQEFKEFAASSLATLEDHREQAHELVSKGGA